MGLIKKSAYLSVSQFKILARIIFVDGTKGRIFGSKEEGLLALSLALKNGEMDEVEALIIEEQIYKSPLPTEHGHVDDVLDTIREESHFEDDDAEVEGEDQIEGSRLFWGTRPSLETIRNN